MSEKKPGRKLPFNVVDVIILVIVEIGRAHV